MPDPSGLDWKLLVQERMKNLRLDPAEKEEVIGELSNHVEDTYESLCREGLCKSDAVQRSLEAVDWERLSRRIQFAKRNEVFMNNRTRQFWIPALVSLAISEGVLLGISFTIPLFPRLLQMGPAALYGPWLLSLPVAGAAGAYLAHRAGSGRRVLLGAVWLPAIVGLGFICAGLLITLLRGVRIFAELQWFYVTLALIVGVISPGIALWLGSLPFLGKAQAKAQ
ncbi:MAG TPA: hypothetical protein VJO35_10115 [Terriglobales bacterium]|nr:hypothetical protein [Terriglobales bacterium]